MRFVFATRIAKVSGVLESGKMAGAFHRGLASELCRLRQNANASQGTLASELDVDQGTISRVESGQRKLTVGEAFAWLEALGLNPAESAGTLQALWEVHGVRPPGFWPGGHFD